MGVEFMALDKEMDTLLFSQADEDDDGVLTQNEFVKFRHTPYMDTPALQGVVSKRRKLEARQQFQQFDLDDSGELDKAEVTTALDKGDGTLRFITFPDDLRMSSDVRPLPMPPTSVCAVREKANLTRGVQLEERGETWRLEIGGFRVSQVH